MRTASPKVGVSARTAQDRGRCRHVVDRPFQRVDRVGRAIYADHNGWGPGSTLPFSAPLRRALVQNACNTGRLIQLSTVQFCQTLGRCDQ